jgi:hypothetical protein
MPPAGSQEVLLRLLLLAFLLERPGEIHRGGVPGTPACNALVLALDATTGALVPGFNGTGIRIFDSGLGTEWLHAIEADVDGKIYAAGVTPNPANPADEDLLVLRINPDGTLDGTFGTGGVHIADSGNAIDGGIGIVLGSAYVLTGWGNSSVRVLKFSTSGKKVVQEAGGGHLFCGLLGPEALLLAALLRLKVQRR